RITRLKYPMLQTTGDANCHRDDRMPVENVLGRVVCFTRKGTPISCHHRFYRLGSWLWRISFPIRPLLLWLLFRMRRRHV
ncbi:MAG: hypothetical protein IKU10_02230, partial [Clostridia bacterium]|nr:hypothetical protein [Clostridia bacterium]